MTPDQFYTSQNSSSFVLSGREASSALLSRVRAQVETLVAQGKRPPGLTVVQVGHDPASGAYIRQKEKAALSCGFVFRHVHLESTDHLASLKTRLLQEVADPAIDGLILQLPLDSSTVKDPNQVRELIELIPATKDADGLSTLNQGHLFTGESTVIGPQTHHPIPATALGVIRLLQHFEVPVRGRECVVIGRSRLVGAPVGTLLMQLGATVTTCHSQTKNLKEHTQHAELLIVCAGRKHLVTHDMIQPGAVVIDVGIHVKEDGKLTGDVHPDTHRFTSAHSPVPGGVGPMTVAGLIENTLNLRLGAV